MWWICIVLDKINSCHSKKKRLCWFNQYPQSIMYHLQWPKIIFEFQLDIFFSNKLTFDKCFLWDERKRCQSPFQVFFSHSFNKYLMRYFLKEFFISKIQWYAIRFMYAFTCHICHEEPKKKLIMDKSQKKSLFYLEIKRHVRWILTAPFLSSYNGYHFLCHLIISTKWINFLFVQASAVWP